MTFQTRLLPDSPDVVAPDGSDVRILLQLGGGSMAHFELAAGQVSRAVAHRTVDEIWYVLHGRGQMWRRPAQREEQAQREQTVSLSPGTCVSIPAGTHFQFRAPPPCPKLPPCPRPAARRSRLRREADVLRPLLSPPS